MTRIIVSTTILILFLTDMFGQKSTTTTSNKDTVDYSSFKFGITSRYYVTSIKQFKGEEIKFTYDGDQFFFNKVDHNNITELGHNSLLKFKIDDTVAVTGWIKNQADVNKNTSKFFSILQLNKKTDVLTIDQESLDNRTKKYILTRKKFSILKWTAYQIVLKDISSPEFNRTYTFRRT